MIANILLAHHYPDPGAGVKIQLYQNMVIVHIKLKGIMNAATWYQIFFSRRPPPPTALGDGFKRSKIKFSEDGHIAYQIQGNHECSNIVANILPADPPPPPYPPTLGVGSIGQYSTFSEHGHVAYQIKENYKCSNLVSSI